MNSAAIWRRLHDDGHWRVCIDSAGRLYVRRWVGWALNTACLIGFVAGVGAPIGLAFSAWSLWEWKQVGRAERALALATARAATG